MVWQRPLGYPFADKLTVRRVPDARAERYHERHHTYMPYLDRVTIHSYGAFLDGELVAAVTFAMPRRSAEVDGVAHTDVVEVARVTVGVDMPNLASAVMARAQDAFMREWGRPNGTELLITFVHEDYEGSMFAALDGKGWQPHREARSEESGNREQREIQREEKELWVCRVEAGDRQAERAQADLRQFA